VTERDDQQLLGGAGAALDCLLRIVAERGDQQLLGGAGAAEADRQRDVCVSVSTRTRALPYLILATELLRIACTVVGGDMQQVTRPRHELWLAQVLHAVPNGNS